MVPNRATHHIFLCRLCFFIKKLIKQLKIYVAIHRFCNAKVCLLNTSLLNTRFFCFFFVWKMNARFWHKHRAVLYLICFHWIKNCNESCPIDVISFSQPQRREIYPRQKLWRNIFQVETKALCDILFKMRHNGTVKRSSNPVFFWVMLFLQVHFHCRLSMSNHCVGCWKNS